MDKLDAGLPTSLGHEAQLHASGPLCAAAQVPVVGEVVRRIPGDHLAPDVLHAGWRALKEPAADAPLEEHPGGRIAAARVALGPPDVDLLGPDAEGCLHAAAHADRPADRVGR